MPKSARTATYDDVNLLLRLYDLRREERLRKARAWFAANFHASSMEEVQKLCPPGSEDNASLRMVTSYWEMAASFVASGVLHEDLFFESNREMLLVWERIKPTAPAFRQLFKDPMMFHNLERVAASFVEWMERRSPGSYEAWKAYTSNLR